MAKNIVFLIVLYKQKIVESSTLKSFSKIILPKGLNIKLLIWDNSPNSQALTNETLSFNYPVEYKHCPDNFPLSKVYNVFFQENINENDYLCIMDQDSKFEVELINEISLVVNTSNPMLLLPKIFHNKVLVSPSRIYWMKGRYIKELSKGFVSSKNMSAINSGMIINSEYLRKNNFSYDARLLNYCTDDYFMKVYRQNCPDLYVLNYKMEHDLSLSTLNHNSSVLKERYKQMLYGRMVVHSDNIFNLMFLRVYMTIHKIYMSLKYRDIEYIFIRVK